VYDVSPVPDELRLPDERRRRAAWLAMLAFGPDAVAVGPCALALHGVNGLPAVVVPEIALPWGKPAHPRDGIRPRYFDKFATTVVGGRRIAGLDAALVQALPELPRSCAVAVLDDVLHRRAVDDERLARIRAAIRGRRGAAAVDGWWGLVDRRAESPLETEARLACVDDGIPPDELQVEIYDSVGQLLGRGDLGWRLRDGRWLLAEIDGRSIHDAPAAIYHDRLRQNRLVASGRVELLRFTKADLGPHGVLVTTVRASLIADASNHRRSA